MNQHYSSSGKVSSMAFLLWIVCAFTVFPILALVYAYAIWYIPIPYLNFLITFIFALVLGNVISRIVLKIGKVRSGKWALIFCLFGALTALYIHWAVWVDLAFNISGTIGSEDIGVAKSNVKFGEVLNLILQPAGLFEVMGEINKVGVWGIKGGTVSGGFLSFIWIVEVLIVTIGTIMIGYDQSTKPFCEFENEWFKEDNLAPVSPIEDGNALLEALKIGDMNVLNAVLQPAGDIKSESHAKITLYDNKSRENYVTIHNEIAGKTDRGEVKFSSRQLTSLLKISQEVADRLKGARS